MFSGKAGTNAGTQLTTRSLLLWRMAQAAVWLAGAVILFCLIFYPAIGILLFWNILIPVAPALFVLATGLWRNVCPLATTNLLPRHLGKSQRKRLSIKQLSKLHLMAVLALYLLVPLRHAIFNENGLATALLIISMVVIGSGMGFVYEWKSAWCSGLCPIHPVEKLYGGNVLLSLPNAHCGQCMNCVIPCPDSTANINPNNKTGNTYQRISSLFIIGGLPGFIWGWFHVPDNAGTTTFQSYLSVYAMPLMGFAITLVAYAIVSKLVNQAFQQKLMSIFAAAGVSCYYWFRIPALFGFGKFANDGVLINLTQVFPVYTIILFTIITTLFFFYWLVIRPQNNRSWVIRPPYARK